MNHTNFYFLFELYSNNYGHDLLDQNSNNYSKYFTINSSYYICGDFFNYTSNRLNITRCNSTVNLLVPHDSNDKMCIDLNNSLLGGNYFSVDKNFFIR